MIKVKFLETIKEYRLLKADETVLVAVSGGADSTALLYLMDYYRQKFGARLHIAHLNHMVRKKDADLDARFVQGLAASLNVPLTIESIDVQALAKQQKKGLEETAREVRYDFFRRVAKKVGADKIAVGHTADDNVETFLMRLVRGAGIKGLCGIPAKRGGIIRPLIKVWRKEIEEYVGGLKLVPRRDYTNYESKYLRNRVRMKLIPQLKLYNLNIKEIILQTILLLTQDSEYLDIKAEEALQGVRVPAGEGEVRLSIEKLHDIESALWGRLLRKAIEEVKGNLLEITYTHICDILDKLETSERWELHLPGGIFVFGGREDLCFSREKPQVARPLEYSYSFSLPGEVEIKELGKKVRADFSEEKKESNDPNVAFVDYAVLGKNLVVRNKRDGDRFQPLGMKGTKKLQDLFVDEKVPPQERGSVPVVESGGRIVWVAGMRIDEAARVSKSTRKIIKLQLL